MSSDLLQSLLSNAWAVLLVVLFFGGSIFVHELGHFLAARWCGLHVERFSIGFGPAIFSWRGKDGVEYRLSWLPLGGYVALPQLAAMDAIEGKSSVDVAKLPPASYSARMLTLVAGATFNLLFALALGCIIWAKGQPMSAPAASTTIGYVAPTLTLDSGEQSGSAEGDQGKNADGAQANAQVPSPAAAAGLRAGDRILTIDGRAIKEWGDVLQGIVTGSGRTATGSPKAIFEIERDGSRQTVTVYPQLAGADQFRRVGIDSGYELIVHEVEPDSLAEVAGFMAGDRLVSLGGQRILNIATCLDVWTGNPTAPLAAVVRREAAEAGAGESGGAQEVALTIPARTGTNADTPLGLAFTTDFALVHPSPVAQIASHARMTWRTLTSLLNPQSDIGLSKMSGPVGIARILHSAAQISFIAVLMFTILINVNLAIFNLLPIPVLDGGQMLFATIARLRRRALPTSFVMATQSAFMILLFGAMLYVTVFGDIRRLFHDLSDKPAATAAAANDTGDPTDE